MDCRDAKNETDTQAIASSEKAVADSDSYSSYLFEVPGVSTHHQEDTNNACSSKNCDTRAGALSSEPAEASSITDLTPGEDMPLDTSPETCRTSILQTAKSLEDRMDAMSMALQTEEVDFLSDFGA